MSQPQVEPRFKAPRQPRARHWSNTVPYKSERRAGQRELRERLCEVALERAAHRCEAAELLPAIACAGELDVHEVIPRSAWPGGHLVLSNVKVCCRAHHRYIGEHQNEAHALGLHGWSWERPAKVEDSDRWAS